MKDKQTNYTIAEGYELPSKGLIYDKPVDGQVELRSMTARDEMKRLNHSTAPYKTLADIIEGCMLEKPAVHVYDMALADYEYLLHKLRVVTYGENYNTDLYCPYCQKYISATIHLDQLASKEFDMDTFKELTTFTLPKSGKLVSINFQTPHMLDEIATRSTEAARKMKDADIDFETYYTLRFGIDSVDGMRLDSVAVENFINKLTAADMQKILNQISKVNACMGLVTDDIHVACPECAGDIKTFFQFGPEFFRPTNL